MIADPPPLPSSPTATVLDHWPPRIWLLMGYKAGDNAQIQALAEALGWPFEIKHLGYRRTELLTNVLLGRTLAGIVRRRSSPLEPPWPDVVISAGRRNEPVARWIRRQAGGQVRLVHMGRPWADLAQFDLIVTTPQYELPERPNVLHNLLPLQRITAERLAAAATRWAPRLAHLPAPRIALLVGGNSGPYTLDRATATYLGQAASRLALQAGGSLLLTTSARTPRAAATALTTALTAPAYCFQWTSQSDENPYLGYLALADAFIVTGDSISMLTEACATCKPVYIFAPDQAVPGLEGGWQQRWERLRFDALIHRLGVRLGLRQLRRDIDQIHRLLIASRRAVWLGQPFPPGPPPPPLEDLTRATARVQALFAPPVSPREWCKPE